MAKSPRFDFVETPSDKNPADQWIFLFHGYGADAYDLRSLSEVMARGTATHWIFPQGIHAVPIGPGWMGRAWWPIAQRDLDGNIVDLEAWQNREPEGLVKLREGLLEWISSFEKDWSKIVLGGFSQGAMLATDLFLHAPSTPRGLLALSGAVVNKPNWKAKTAARAGARFFQSHGRQDPVLPYRGASQLESLLTGGGLKGSLYSFDGSHEIPMNVIEKANEYLKSLNAKT